MRGVAKKDGSVSKVVVKGGDITEITINRPEKHNAMDMETLKGLEKAIRSASAKKECRAIVIDGEGGKAFSAGGDINMLFEADEKKAGEIFDAFLGVISAIRESEKIVIAAITGYCFGGGCEIACACDFRFASIDAKFAQPEVRIGVTPGGGATYNLGRIIGLQKARMMIFTGGQIDAKTALSFGLVDRIVNRGIMEYIRRFISETGDAEVVGFAKMGINRAIRDKSSVEREFFVRSLVSKRAKTAMAAFLGRKGAR